MPREKELGIQRILGSVAVLAAVFLFSLEALQPPAAKPLSAPPDQFSAGRAIEILTRVMGSQIPHPTGSDANNAVRDRISHEFSKIGYRSQIESGFKCSQFGTCATVNNIVARLDGRERSAVLLAAHYDSVRAGPGVSDDGVGVAAALEIARALKYFPVPRHSIIFLIDDGEEAGLLGAREFVDSHPWAKDVRAVVNLDARGTSGPSLMFETGSGNAWAARLYVKSVPHPATSSVFYTVYKQLPNDTDFTVFKAAGYEGLNFAFIDNVVLYHTPLDNTANVTPASVQHQGDNALPSLIAFGNADFSHIGGADEVYFDLFEWRAVRIPGRWPAALGIIAVLLIGWEVGFLLRSGRLAPRQLLRGIFPWLIIIIATAVLGLLLQRLMQLTGAIPVNWIAHPLPVELAFWFLAFSVVILIAVLFAPSCSFWGLWSGLWIWWSLFLFLTLWQARGLSYVLLIPAAVAALSAVPSIFFRMGSFEDILAGSAVVLPLTSSAILGFPIAILLYDGLGNRALPAIAVLVALLFTPILPLCVDFLKIRSVRGVALFWIPAVVTFAAAFTAILMPAYSTKAPERVNIEYWKDADTGKSQWIVEAASGRFPETAAQVASFQRADQGPFPWDTGPAFLAPAPGLNQPAPTLTILESTSFANRRIYRALLRSERGAPEVMALFPPGADVTTVRMNGQLAEASIGRPGRPFGGWKVYRCLTAPAEGVELAFALPLGKALEVYAVDSTSGLPPAVRSLDARPIIAAPSQDGDVTLVSRRVQLIP